MTTATAELVLYEAPNALRISEDWLVSVDGQGSNVLWHTRSTFAAVPNWWDEDDIVSMSWLKFGLTGLAVTLVLTPLHAGAFTEADVHIYPRVTFFVVGSQIVIPDFRERDGLFVVVGDYASGGTRHPLAIQCSAPRPSPSGTVIVYDGEQVAALTGTTLHFTNGPAVYELSSITMQEGSAVEIDGDVLVIARQFGGVATEGWLVDGHGTISGEGAVWEDVVLLPFAEQLGYVLVNAFDEVATSAAGTRVHSVTLIASPLFSIQVASVDGVMVLNPWTPNSDGVHLGSQDVTPSLLTHSVLWTGDDTIVADEGHGQHVIASNLLASSYSATLHLGYFPFVQWNPAQSRVTNNDVMSVASFADHGAGRHAGFTLVGWCDGANDGGDVSIEGYHVAGLRVWADPSGEIRTRPVDLSNHKYPWPGLSPQDAAGNIRGITLRDVWFEVEPLHRSRLIGRDAHNGIRDLLLQGIRYGGTPTEGGTYLANANFDTYFETNKFADWRIDNTGFVMTLNDTRLPQIPTAGTVTDDDDLPIFQDGPPQRRLSWAALKAKLEADGFLVTEGIDGDVSGFLGGVGVITDQFTVDEMTDGEGTSGTYEMSSAVPAGAILLGSKVVVNAGFAGDTTATFTIGDGSDADRYMTGTPSCFATDADGVETGVPSGAKLIQTANAPIVTVTSSTDFGLVQLDGSGIMTVSIYFIRTV